MMKVTILVCAIGMPQADCSVDTATAVIQGPDAESLVTCGLHGQAYIADTAIADYADDEHYIKLRCTMGERSTDSTAIREALQLDQ
jgi:hypothetical protein